MDLLLSILIDEQKSKGYISEEAIKRISDRTGIPVSNIYGTATFYHMLHTKPQGKNIIYVCTSPSCIVNGSTDILKILKKQLKLAPGQSNKKFSLYQTSCIGCCDKAPAMLLNGKAYGNLTEAKIKSLLKKCKS